MSEKIDLETLVQPKGFPSLPRDWELKGESFQSDVDQTHLFLYQFSSTANPKRGLFVLHGLGEHGGRYLHLPHYLKNEIDVIWCLDHRGHGRSGGIRGYVPSFQALIDDAENALKLAQQRHPSCEWHLLGHSMGGLVAVRLLQDKPQLNVRSATFSAPLLKVKAAVPAFKKWLARSLTQIPVPYLSAIQFPSEIDPKILSHDSAVAAAYTTDRLVHRKVTPQFFVELEETFELVAQRASQKIGIPTQFLIPLRDELVDSNATLEFAREYRSETKKVKTFPDLFHEILNEQNKEQTIAEVGNWIRENSQL